METLQNNAPLDSGLDAVAPKTAFQSDSPLFIELSSLGDEVDVELDGYARYVHLEIVRDPMERVSNTCYEHEIPILRSIHGESNIVNARVVSRFVEISSVAEHGRLAGYYGMASEDQSFVEKIYGPVMAGRLKQTLDHIYKRDQANHAHDPSKESLGTHVTVHQAEANADVDGAKGQHLPWGIRKLDKTQLVGKLQMMGATVTSDQTKAELLDMYATLLDKELA